MFFNKKHVTCVGNFEKEFLDDFQDYGISLYNAPNENLTQWDQLNLNFPSATVTINPCNLK